MSILFIGDESDTSENGEDAFISLSGLGLAENDIVLVFGGFTTLSAPAVNSGPYTPSDYNSLGQIDSNDGTHYIRTSVAWKRMGVSPDTSVLCRGTGNANDCCAYSAFVLRGVDTTTAIDATTTTATGTAGSPNSPSITTVTQGALVFSFGASTDYDTDQVQPSNYTLVETAVRNDGVNTAISIGSALRSITTPGAENPGPWADWTGGTWTAATVAIRPDLDEAVVNATGDITVSFVGSVGSAMALSASGRNTTDWVGDAISTGPAVFAATMSGSVEFGGEGSGFGTFDIAATASVAFVGGKEYMSSVREVIESRGAASVTVN
jgi:hypothetical protein